MRFFRNSSGFSMVQGMVLAGIIAGSSLVATKLMTEQKKALKGAETRDQIEELNDLIYTVLQVRLNCRQTMVLNSLQTNLGATPGIPDYYSINGISTHDAATGEFVAQAGGTYMNNNVFIKSITLREPNTGAPGGPRIGTRNLEIVYERLNGTDATKRTKIGTGGKEIKKIITISIQKNPTDGSFTGCNAVMGDKADMNGIASNETGNDLSKEMCNELNSGGGKTVFVWDEANSICKPDAACPAGEIYTGFDTLGRVYCRNIRDWMDFNNVLDSTPPTCNPGDNVRFEINTAVTPNKVRIICTP